MGGGEVRVTVVCVYVGRYVLVGMSTILYSRKICCGVLSRLDGGV